MEHKMRWFQSSSSKSETQQVDSLPMYELQDNSNIPQLHQRTEQQESMDQREATSDSSNDLPRYSQAAGRPSPAYPQSQPSEEYLARAEKYEQRKTRLNWWNRKRIKIPIAICCALITAGGLFGPKVGIEYDTFLHPSSDPARLNTAMQQRATDIYKQCYNGCEPTSSDLECALDACQRTSQVQANGTICDGGQMWTWDERYPADCLESLGKEFRAEALEDVKSDAYFYAVSDALIGLWLFLVHGLGFYSFLGGHLMLRSMTADREARRARLGMCSESEARAIRLRAWWAKSFWSKLAIVFCLPSPANAFPCWNHGKSEIRFFTNINGISGKIHGWTSDCHNQTIACKDICTIAGPRGYTCMESLCNKSVEVSTPMDFVNAVVAQVVDCGFNMTEEKPTASLRIANSKLESERWVTIQVNTFNVSGVVDPSVLCLWDIGNH